MWINVIKQYLYMSHKHQLGIPIFVMTYFHSESKLFWNCHLYYVKKYHLGLNWNTEKIIIELKSQHFLLFGRKLYEGMLYTRVCSESDLNNNCNFSLQSVIFLKHFVPHIHTQKKYLSILRMRKYKIF